MYILVAGIVAFISYKLFKRTGADMNLRGLNMLSWIYYVQFILMCLVGPTIALQFGYKEHYMFCNVSDKTLFNGWLIILYVMILFPLSVLSLKHFFCVNNTPKIMRCGETALHILQKKNFPLLNLLTIIALCSCLYVFIKSGYVSLFKLFGDKIEIAQMRINYSRNFPGNQYIKNIFATTLMQIVSYVWYIRFRLLHRQKEKLYFWICLTFSLLISIQGFEKAPVVMYIVSFYMLRILLYGRVSKTTIISVSTVSVFLIGIMYFVTTHSGFYFICTSMVTRIIFSQIGGFFQSLGIFGTMHEYIGFTSMSRAVSYLFNIGNSPRSARIVMEIFNPTGVAAGIAGVMDSLFVAEAWANWGIIGIFLSPLIAGTVTGLVYYNTTAKNNVSLWAMYAYMSVRMPVISGINDFIYPISYVIPVFFVVFLEINYEKPKTIKTQCGK